MLFVFFWSCLIFVFVAEIWQKMKSPDEAKKKKIMEAEENKKNIKMKQSIESTIALNDLESKILNEFR